MTNPYAPPTTDVDLPAPPARRKPVAFVLLGLSALQLLWLLRYSYAYLELVRTGATGYGTAFVGFVGCILLYVGAARFAGNAARGNRLFIVAAVACAWAAPRWSLQYAWSYPYVLGAALAAAGAWLSRRRAQARRGEG